MRFVLSSRQIVGNRVIVHGTLLRISADGQPCDAGRKVIVNFDLDQLGREMAEKACRSRRGKSTAMNGAIVCREIAAKVGTT